MIQEACNNFVLVLREATEQVKSGMVIPGQGREKPHAGTIHAVGELVEDPKIKAAVGRKCLFHKTVGFDIDYEGIVYLVLQDREIIALP